LPAELGQLTTLQTLDLGECGDLESLPAEICQLTATLQNLNLIDSWHLESDPVAKQLLARDKS
jgi:hypothetical protein